MKIHLVVAALVSCVAQIPRYLSHDTLFRSNRSLILYLSSTAFSLTVAGLFNSKIFVASKFF